MGDDLAAETLARLFHEAYERLAPDFGYETRRESAKPWVEVPEQNRALMIAVCAELLPQVVAAGRRQAAEEIAVAIEAVKPSVKRFWDTADAARVYALNDAAKIARQLGAPAEPVGEDTP